MKRKGNRTFLTIWSGQLVSQIGTAMTRFALLIWAYQQTGSATTVALLGFFAFLPMLLVSPVAGVWVDRIDRRKIMLLADAGAGLMTAAMLLLYVTGHLAVWHLYLAEGLAGIFEAFQRPAYMAATSTLLPKEQYTRANGLRSLADFGAQVLAPVFGGLLLTWADLGGVMLVDMATFLVAFITLMMVRLPAAVGEVGVPSVASPALHREIRVGYRYIRQRPGLVGLTAIMAAVYFFAALTWSAIMPAMILARSGQNELALASVQSAMGIAGVVGGVLVSLWGGPKRKIHGVLAGIALSFLLGDIPLAIGRTLPIWIGAASVGSFFIPIIFSAHDAIWQSKVEPALQGRVFATKEMIMRAFAPAGYLLSGVLADRLLEPAMAVDGWLAPTLGWLVGTGPGAGMALMFVASAVCAIFICLVGYLLPALRRVEDDLPDHDYGVVPEAAVQTA